MHQFNFLLSCTLARESLTAVQHFYSSLLAHQGPEEYMEVLLASLDAVRRRVPPSSAPLLARLASQAEEEEAPAASGLLPQASALRTAFVEATAVMSTYFTDFMDRSLRCGRHCTHAAHLACLACTCLA